MKKILGIGLLLMAAAAHADDVITDKMVGAFEADENVQTATRTLRQGLVANLPGCTLTQDPALRGHMWAVNASVRPPNVRAVSRIYLVSRGITCTRSANGTVIAYRRSVTAKITTAVRNVGGVTQEDPTAVVVVNIANSPLEN